MRAWRSMTYPLAKLPAFPFADPNGKVDQIDKPSLDALSENGH